MLTGRKLTPFASVAVLLLATAACGTSEPEDTGASGDSSASRGVPQTNQPAPPINGPGILVTNCSGKFWRVDPSSGRTVATRTISFQPPRDRGTDLRCGSTYGGAEPLRGTEYLQKFDKNLNRAVVASGPSWGSQILLVHGNGQTQQLTPVQETGQFDIPLTYWSPRFNHKTGEIWFLARKSNTEIGSEDATIYSINPANGQVTEREQCDGCESIVIPSDSDRLIADYTDAPEGQSDDLPDAISEDGSLVVYNNIRATGAGSKWGNIGNVMRVMEENDDFTGWDYNEETDFSYEDETPECINSPTAIVDEHHVICNGSYGRLILISLDEEDDTATQKSLLPEKVRTDIRGVGSPDASQIMFLVGSPGDRAMYRVPITGGDPVKVADVPGAQRILSWR